MHGDTLLIDFIVILCAVVVCVPLLQRLRLGSFLGHLVAGVLIGPFGLALVGDLESLSSLAELGVVFLLFAVGLELPISRLKVMPIGVFVLGIAQVLVTGGVIGLCAAGLGATVDSAIVIGGALALSSTAVVLVLLSEHGELTSRFGRSAVTVLLIQDLMVGPLLAIAVTLGQTDTSMALSIGAAVLKMIAALVVIVGGGRIVLRPLFWLVADSRIPEAFAALSILVVLATSLATQFAGLSMAFGAFLAGILLADSRYRHQVEAEIQPFRGLLLGLFFVTVGMSLDVHQLLDNGHLVIPMALGLLLVKAVILVGLGIAFRLPLAQSIQLGMTLSQGGEFAFILLGAGVVSGILPTALGQLVVLVVAITMAVTPLLAISGKAVAQRVRRTKVVEVEAKPPVVETLDNHVFVAGFGRVGRAVAQRLSANKIPFVAVDLDPRNVAPGRERGLMVFYGDATRPEVLEAVHVERASAAIVALDNPAAALRVVALLRYIFPDLKIHARARDEDHATALRSAGADTVVPEVIATSAKLVGSCLENYDEASDGTADQLAVL
jgi:CPA2 family monovalent cation:H+ antiporter-2